MNGRKERIDGSLGIPNPGDPSLPVAGQGTLSRVRASRTSRWRAAVLIGVHLLIAAHITHFMVAGRTLSPVEPSESMYTLELGELNAGFIFFAVALLSTLIFGRLFCGWGCHIVALQDFCGWIMKKAGIRPRPLRSRLLVWVPLVAALYMFVWPTVMRLTGIDPRPFPGLRNGLVTDGFWDTFPGPLYAALTLAVCGFAAVYFLGAKGFCTYGCPYGGFFGFVDQFAVGRIVVNESCEQCGHCTATCTSNVRVHEEVRRFGQVVDPGCMKCMDCVSVCPMGALSFGVGKPAVLKGAGRGAAPRRHYDFTVVEELVFLLVGFVSCLAFRGLYDGPPLLMSIGLGGISGFLALKLWRLASSATVRVQNLNLKLAGELRRAGVVFAVAGIAWFALVAHSAWMQWELHQGARWLERTEISRTELLDGAWRQREMSAAHDEAVRRSLRHFAAVDRWGLADWVEVKLGLAWLYMVLDDPAAAEAHVRRAVALTPRSPSRYESLAEFLSWQGRHTEAAAALRKKIEVSRHPDARDYFRLGAVLIQAEQFHPAVDAYHKCLELAPQTFDARFSLGVLLHRLGRTAEAVTELTAATQLDPQDAPAQIELGLALADAGRPDEAAAALRRAIELDPDSPEAHRRLPQRIRELEAAGS